jgi:hypothetical protein
MHIIGMTRKAFKARVIGHGNGFRLLGGRTHSKRTVREIGVRSWSWRHQ